MFPEEHSSFFEVLRLPPAVFGLFYPFSHHNSLSLKEYEFPRSSSLWKGSQILNDALVKGIQDITNNLK
jgi:hypothetical protein